MMTCSVCVSQQRAAEDWVPEANQSGDLETPHHTSSNCRTQRASGSTSRIRGRSCGNFCFYGDTKLQMMQQSTQAHGAVSRPRWRGAPNRQQRPTRKKEGTCFRCGKSDHWIRDCTKPPWEGENQRRGQRPGYGRGRGRGPPPGQNFPTHQRDEPWTEEREED